MVRADDLGQVTLIVAIFDHDKVGSHEFMGVVLVPLEPGQGIEAAVSAGTYECSFDEPVLLYGTTVDTGRLKGKLRVSFNQGLEGGLEAAREGRAGENANLMTKHNRMLAVKRHTHGRAALTAGAAVTMCYSSIAERFITETTRRRGTAVCTVTNNTDAPPAADAAPAAGSVEGDVTSATEGALAPVAEADVTSAEEEVAAPAPAGSRV